MNRFASCQAGAIDTDRPPPETDTSDLSEERRALERIRRAHAAHLDRARRNAERLAAEAAEETADGIRDLVDEDGEVDAAARAAAVRQISAQAMHAGRRYSDLVAAGDALAFGHTTSADGDRTSVGRTTVLEGDDVLLVDWRAHAAAPFYRATPLEPMGVAHRRHLVYDDPGSEGSGTLVGYSDEVFDAASVGEGVHLRGEAALLASLRAATDGQMRSIVATIQSEQDAVIRAPADRALVVQGGPGTGKTVVALHRAAYLLYHRRSALAESGVLVVGPTQEFLHHIARVLPSLGESGVVSMTAEELFPGVRRGGSDTPEVAWLKGREVMADLLAEALAIRRRTPTEPLVAWYGSDRLVVDTDRLVQLTDSALRHRRHNDGADALRSAVTDALLSSVASTTTAQARDAARALHRSPHLRRFCDAHWPVLTAEQALNDLLGSKAMLRTAARAIGLCPADAESLHHPRTAERDLDRRKWSDADISLLDELHHLLGPPGAETEEERIAARDELSEFELAEAAELEADPLDELDDADELADRDEIAMLERLAADPEDAERLGLRPVPLGRLPEDADW